MKLCLSEKMVCGGDYILAVDGMSNARIFHSGLCSFLVNRPPMTRILRINADQSQKDQRQSAASASSVVYGLAIYEN